MIVEWRRLSGTLTTFNVRITVEDADVWCIDELRNETESVYSFVDPFVGTQQLVTSEPYAFSGSSVVVTLGPFSGNDELASLAFYNSTAAPFTAILSLNIGEDFPSSTAYATVTPTGIIIHESIHCQVDLPTATIDISRATAYTGQSYSVSWSSSGATSVQVRWRLSFGIWTTYSTNSSGSVLYTVAADWALGEREWEIRATNSAGTSVDSASIDIIAAPRPSTTDSPWSSLRELPRQGDPSTDSEWSTLRELLRQGDPSTDSEWSGLVELPRQGEASTDSDWSSLADLPQVGTNRPPICSDPPGIALNLSQQFDYDLSSYVSDPDVGDRVVRLVISESSSVFNAVVDPGNDRGVRVIAGGTSGVGTVTFRAVDTSGLESDECSFGVTVGTAPQGSVDISATPNPVGVGFPTTIEWSSNNAANVVVERVVSDLPAAVLARGQANGSWVANSPSAAGMRTYEITADDGLYDSVTVSWEVLPTSPCLVSWGAEILFMPSPGETGLVPVEVSITDFLSWIGPIPASRTLRAGVMRFDTQALADQALEDYIDDNISDYGPGAVRFSRIIRRSYDFEGDGESCLNPPPPYIEFEADPSFRVGLGERIDLTAIYHFAGYITLSHTRPQTGSLITRMQRLGGIDDYWVEEEIAETHLGEFPSTFTIPTTIEFTATAEGPEGSATERVSLFWGAGTTDSNWSSLRELPRAGVPTTDSEWSTLRELPRAGVPTVDISVSDDMLIVGTRTAVSWSSTRADSVEVRSHNILNLGGTGALISTDHNGTRDWGLTTSPGTLEFSIEATNSSGTSRATVRATWTGPTTDSPWSSLEELPRTDEITTDSEWSSLEEFRRQAVPGVNSRPECDPLPDVELDLGENETLDITAYLYDPDGDDITIHLTRPTVTRPSVSVTVSDRSPDVGDNVTVSWSITGGYLTSDAVTDPFGGNSQSGSRTVSRSTAGSEIYTASAWNAAGSVSDSETVEWAVTPLSVMITGPTSVAQGVSFSLIPSVSGGQAPYSYRWETETGGVSTGDTFFVSGNTPAGTYTLDLTVTDDNGTTATDSHTVTINAPPSLSVMITGPTSVAQGVSFSLIPSVSGGQAPYSYRWETETGGVSTGDTFFVSGNTPAGTYTLDLTVTDDNGTTATDSHTVTINAPPSLSVMITGPTSIESGDNATLIADASGGSSPYSYIWSTGATSRSISVSPSSATEYVVTVTDANNSSVTVFHTITVTGDSLTAAITGPVTALAGGPSITLVVGASGGAPPYTYRWSPGNTTTQSRTISFGPNTMGMFVFSCLVTDSNFFEAQASHTITVT